MLRYKEGELESKQIKAAMITCLNAELELGRPLTKREVKEQFLNTVAPAKTLGRPLKSSSLMITICFLGSWAAIITMALIAGMD